MELMGELAGIGYTEEWRTRVLRSAMTGYMRVLKNVTDGTVRRNRKVGDTLNNRWFKSLVGAKEWFRVDRGDDDAWEIVPP